MPRLEEMFGLPDPDYGPGYFKMHAYPDPKCTWGYMLVCDECKPKAPLHVLTTHPITNPPALGKKQQCEQCGKTFVLENP